MTSNSLFDVPDATDWASTLLCGFVAVESPMRCQVCKEFIKTPMITSCGHTFCSECIRRSLSHNGLCPACRSPDQELKLRANKSMEEVVEAFQRTREGALEVARGQPQERSPKRKRRDVGSREESLEPSKKTRTSSRISSRATPQFTLDGGADLEVESDEDYTPNDGLVPCPVCGERMKEPAVNKHMDDIHFNPAPPRQSTTLSSFTTLSPAPRQNSNKTPSDLHPKPLPTISYNLLKDKALRDKLHSLGIPSHGTRPLMERRHREWMTLWNANCDATHPKSKKELLKQLDEWERTQAYPAAHRGPKESQVANKEFDGKEWANQHADEFVSLVEKARKQVAERREKEKSAAHEAAKEAQETSGSREPQRIDVAARRMSQEVDVHGNMDEESQPVKVSAELGSNQGTSADDGSIPKEQQATELDTWWMRDMVPDVAAPNNSQSQSSTYLGTPQLSQQPVDHRWNDTHSIPQDDSPWTTEAFAFGEQVYPRHSGTSANSIDPVLSGPSEFDFDAFLAQPHMEEQTTARLQQANDIAQSHLQPMMHATNPPSLQPLPSSQPTYQQRHHQLPPQPPQQPPQYRSPPLKSLYQNISPSPSFPPPPPSQQQPHPPSGQQNHWQADPSGDFQLQRMLQHGDMRNRDGSQMTAQQRLEILKRPYKRTGSDST